jgi:chromosome segregation ATPase
MLPSLSKEGRNKSAMNAAAQQMLGSDKDNEVREKLRLYKTDDLRRELEQKNISIGALQRNYEALTFAHREEKLRFEEAESKSSRLSNENSILLAQLKETRDRLDQKNAEVAALKQEGRQILKLQEEMHKMKTDSDKSKAVLNTRLKDYADKDRVIKEVRQELELTRSNSLQLKEQLKEMHSKCLVYKGRYRDTEALLGQAKAVNEELTANLAAAQGQVGKFQQESASMLGDLADLRQGSQALSQKLGLEKEEFSKLRTKYAELMKYCNDLKASNEGHNLLLVSSAHSENDLRKKVEAAEALNLALRAQLQSLEDKKAEEVREQHAYYGQAIAELNSKLALQNSTIDDLSKSLADTTNRYAFLQDDRKRQDLRLKDLEARVASDLQAKRTEQQLASQLSQLEEELRQTLRQKEAVIAELQIRCENFESDNKEKERTLKHLNTRLKELSNLEKTAREMAEQLNYNRNSHTRLASQLSGLLDEKDQLELQVKTLQHSTSALHNRLSEENLELHSEKANLIANLQTISHEIQEMRSQLEQRDLQLRQMQSEVERASSASDSVSRSAKSEAEVLRKELQRLSLDSSHKIQTLEADLQRSNESLRELSGLKSEQQLLKEKTEGVLRKVSSRQNAELMKELDAARLELRTQQATKTHEANDRQQLVSRIETLKAQLETFQSRPSLETVVKVTVDKLRSGVDALESELCCNSCQELIDSAVVCVPCGHYYCQKCPEGYQPHCRRCDGPSQTMKLSILDSFVAKLGYQKQVLDDASALVS